MFHHQVDFCGGMDTFAMDLGYYPGTAAMEYQVDYASR